MFLNSKAQKGIATFLFEIFSIFATAAVTIAFCFTFLFRTVVVDGGSMNPTLYDKDRVLITAGFENPKYGDIVVIAAGGDGYDKTLIKRVIATAGQTVDIDFETGDVTVDGELLHENYIADPTTVNRGMVFPCTVPENCVFCMGDNRLHSTDSRDPNVGFINTKYVMGKVMVKLSPGFDAHIAEI